MCIGKNHPRGLQFYLGTHGVNTSTGVKDLGISYSNTLSFDKYVDDVVAAAHKKSNFILRPFNTRNSSTLYRLLTV